MSEEITSQCSEIICNPEEGVSKDRVEILIDEECEAIFNCIKVQHQNISINDASNGTESNITASFLHSFLTSSSSSYTGIGLVIIGIATSAIMVSAWPLAISAAGVALIGVSGLFSFRQPSENTEKDNIIQKIAPN